MKFGYARVQVARAAIRRSIFQDESRKARFHVRNSAVVLSVFWAALGARVVADEPPLRWVRNLDDARQIAAAEHKDLLVNFTGLEWCGHCMDLEEGVLSRREFRAASD